MGSGLKKGMSNAIIKRSIKDISSAKLARAGEKLRYDPKTKIGRGGFSVIFEGLFDEKMVVAVKRFQLSDVENEVAFRREADLMMRAGEHPNILQYLYTEITDDFVFIATELCAGTLENLINGTYQGPALLQLGEREILYQVSQGLAHLHRNKIIHRDIKPSNILIFVPEGDGELPQMKLADFGLSKILDISKEDFTNTGMGDPSGTKGWMAPELYKSRRYDSKVDIFPLGCIFGYTLSGGLHPFGDDPIERHYRVKHKMPLIMTSTDLKIPYCQDKVVFQLILSMVEMEPAIRPSVEVVLKNPFFIPCKNV